MNNQIKIFSILFFVVISCSVFGQIEAISETIEPIDGLTESSLPDSSYYLDDIVVRSDLVEELVLPLETLREADIPWQKRVWRVIDVREKMNLPFQYPLMPFFTILKDHVENGDIKAFFDEGFKEEMLAEDIQLRINRIDTITDYDEETYEDIIRIVPNEINPEDIKKYRVKEIWYFDKESSTMGVRILGIAPLRDVFDQETGEYKYTEPVFWIYYPETRQYLAKYHVVNDDNDASPMNWESLFTKRFFASYIYKVSNSLDVRVEDMYPGEENGIERLMESEKIKNELFNFEHDLWEY